MNFSKIKADKPFDQYPFQRYNIIGFGNMNDLPQKLRKIVQSSPTATCCLDVYKRFLFGEGIENLDDEATQVIHNCIEDYALFGGFAILFDAKEIAYIPFEFVRIVLPDDDYEVKAYAVHPDWTGEKIRKDIPFLDRLPDPGSVTYYKKYEEGEQTGLYYFNKNDDNTYPLPNYYASITDMSTEGGIINMSYRNARHNFFPSGIVCAVDKSSNTPEDFKLKQEEMSEKFLQFQGDERACKIMYMSIDDPELQPQFIPFQTQNLDTLFQNTAEQVKDRIGRCFSQPPILRGEDTGNNFGQDAINNAYQFYNTITKPDREMLMEKFSFILEKEIEIKPLIYIEKDTPEKLSADDVDVILSIIESNMDKEVKWGIIQNTFGFEDDEMKEIFKSSDKLEPEEPEATDNGFMQEGTQVETIPNNYNETNNNNYNPVNYGNTRGNKGNNGASNSSSRTNNTTGRNTEEGTSAKRKPKKSSSGGNKNDRTQ